MGNSIFEALLEEKIKIFINSFLATAEKVFYDPNKKNKLLHPGEYGMYRESIVKEFLRFFIPQAIAINTGFVINSSNKVSTQCDLVFFDYNNTPLLETGEKQKFFPIETVVGIGEIKSILNKTQLIEALEKIESNKSIRDELNNPNIVRRASGMGSFNPSKIPFDQVFSFIICEQLNFDYDKFFNSNLKINRNQINLILSIKDGLFCYWNNESSSIPYPFLGDTMNQPNFLKLDSTDRFLHIKNFVHFIFLLTSNTTILHLDIVNYFNKNDLKNLIKEN